MIYRSLGRTGLNVSALGFGGAAVGATEGERAAAQKTLTHLLDNGVNLVDTAQVYPGSEELIGRVLRSRREKAIVVTKCGHHEERPDGTWRSKAVTMNDVDLALVRLQIETIDVMLLHSYDRDLLENGEAINVLVKAQGAGKIRLIGYSGDNATAAAAASMPAITVVETSINIVDQANITIVLPTATRKNVGVIAKRPLGNAVWEHLGDGNDVPDHHAEYFKRLQALGFTPGDFGIDGADGWSELALRFTLSIPGVHSAIVGTTNIEKAKTNLKFVAKGPLADDVVEKIQDAFENAESEAGELWKGQN